MADKRICYAGDLTSDALGKTVVFTAGGKTYTEPLEGIRHDPHGTKLYLADGVFGKVVRLDSETTIVEVRRSPEGGASS